MAHPAPWGLIIRRIIAFQFLILFGQGTVVLWLRHRDKRLHFFRFNKLGLIHIELLNEVVLLMLIYSLCAFLDLSTQEFVERGLLRYSTKLVLHTTKFSISVAVSWLFFWILGIESLLNLSSLGARARAGASIKLSLSKRLALNTLLFAVILIPVAIVLWISIVTASYLRDIETVSEQIIVALLKRAPTYHAGSYSPLNLLGTLKPADNLLSRSELTASHIKLLLLVYLSQHLIISALYLPTSIILLRNLKDRHRSLGSGLLTRAGAGESPITERGNLLLQVRKRLSTQVFLIHLEEILYLPPIIYLFFAINGVKFYSDPTWVLLDQIAMHGPAAFIGNIVLTCAIQNTLFTIRIPKFKSAPQNGMSLQSNPVEMNVHQAIKFQSNDPTDPSSLEPQTLSLDLIRTESQDFKKVHERPRQ